MLGHRIYVAFFAPHGLLYDPPRVRAEIAISWFA